MDFGRAGDHAGLAVKGPNRPKLSGDLRVASNLFIIRTVCVRDH
jgi:hypothetical protein